MKKFLIALAAGVLLLGGQTQAAPVDDLNAQIEMQETSAWPEIRDKLLGRETDRERRERKEWERHHRYAPPRHHDRYHHHPPRLHHPPGHHHDRHHHW